MVGSVTFIGWPEADMDFWCRGRVDTAEATAEPAEDVLLADISVRLLPPEQGGGDGQTKREKVSVKPHRKQRK